MESAVERIGAVGAMPLDRVRAALLRAGGAPVRYLVRHREARVAVGGTMAVVLAFALATVFPLGLLLLGPVVLGVPHLAADFRYVVLRIGLHRVLAGALALPAFVAAVLLSSPPLGLVAAAIASAVTPGSVRRRVVLVASFVAGAAWLSTLAHDGLVVFAHGHNFVAVVLWTMWWRDRSALRLLPIVALVAATAAIALGAVDFAFADRGAAFAGVPLESFRASLAPGVADPWAGRLVIAFAMAQSVHYAIWLRLVPDDDRERTTPRTFAASWRAFVADLGGIGALATVALAAGLVGWALVDLGAARDGYLRLAAFHGYVELIGLGVLAVRPLREG
jgi:hypothetical protein